MTLNEQQKNLWTATASGLARTEELSTLQTCETAIIGGGFTGLSAALHLAEAGVETIVLEANTIGFGGSGRNVGLVNAGMWVRPDDLVATLGETIGNRLLSELGDGPAYVYSLVDKHGIDCEDVRNGTLHMAVGEAGATEIATRAAQWQKRGAPVEALGASEASRLTGANGFAGALLDRRAGTIQPLSYAQGLARAAMAAGARIFTGSAVISAYQDAGAIVLKTRNGEIRAKKLILASNDYASVVPGLNWSGHDQQLTLMSYFQFATAPLPADVIARILPDGHGTWDTGLVMTSFRKDKAGRLIFGSIGQLDQIATSTHRAFAKRSLAALFPFLGPVEFDYWWDGKIGMTRNNLPCFHQPDENVWSITGYNGRGISPGTVFGRMLAGVAMGKPDAMALAPVAIEPDPLRTIKKTFYDFGSMAKHLIDRRSI
jgi:glycine/D-amino acid oxidase-like deaminating enzyme